VRLDVLSFWVFIHYPALGIEYGHPAGRLGTGQAI